MLDQTEKNYELIKVTSITAVSFMGINSGIILILWFFMVFDTLLGMWKSVVLYDWPSLNRKEFAFGVGTKMAVLFIPLSIAFVGQFANYDLKIFVDTTMWVLIANDAISCYTNILSIKKKKDYVNKDLVEALVTTLRDLIYSGAKAALNRLKSNDLCDFDDTKESGGDTGRDTRPPDSESDKRPLQS